MRSRVISSSAPNGSSISSIAGSARPAPGRWRPAAACRRTAPTDGARRSRPGRTSSSSSATARGADRESQPCSSSGSSTLAATVRQSKQPGLLERDAVVLVQAGLPAGLPLTSTDPALGVSRSRDQAQQRRLPAAGRPDQRDELARADVEVDAGQRRHLALAAGVEHLVDAGRDGDRRRSVIGRLPRTAAHAGRGRARRRARRRAISPSSAGADDRAVEPGGVAGGLLGVVDDQPPDAAARARSRSRATIAPTTDGGGRQPAAPGSGTARRPGTAASPASRGPAGRVRAHQLHRQPSGDCSPRSAPTATGKKAR